MGKKLLSQASLKISKNQKQQQFNSLIKVLRPKVYITDSSSFKKLVQELTGNGSSTPSSPKVLDTCHLAGAKVQRGLETSFEVSSSSEATTSLSEFSYTGAMNEDFNLVYNQTGLDYTVLGDSEANQQIDHLLEYQNLESLLFDVEPNPFVDCYAQIEQEVSIYDYELLGLL